MNSFDIDGLYKKAGILLLVIFSVPFAFFASEIGTAMEEGQKLAKAKQAERHAEEACKHSDAVDVVIDGKRFICD